MTTTKMVQCKCGQKLSVQVPPQGALVQCPSCKTKLRVAGQPAGVPSPPPPSAAPTSPSSDPFADLGNLPSPQPAAFAAPQGGAASSGNPYLAQTTGNSNQQKRSLLVPILVAVGTLSVVLLIGVAGLIFIAVRANEDSQTANLKKTQTASGNVARLQARISQPPITEQEARKLADQFASTFNRPGSPSAADKMIDFDAMLDKSFAEFDVTSDSLRGYRIGFMKSLKQNSFVGRLKAQGCRSVTLLRMRRSPTDDPTALFRLNQTDDGVGYVETSIGKNASGQVVIDDIYSFSTGEWMSRTLRDQALPLVAEENRSFLAKLSGPAHDQIKYTKELQSYAVLAQTNPTAAISAYQKLPVSLQHSKSVLVLQVIATQRSGNDQQYQRAMETYRKFFPDDEAQLLFSIDYFILKGDIPASIRATQALNRSVGGDAALLTIVGGLHIQTGDVEQAKVSLRKALQLDPDYNDAKDILGQLE